MLLVSRERSQYIDLHNLSGLAPRRLHRCIVLEYIREDILISSIVCLWAQGPRPCHQRKMFHQSSGEQAQVLPPNLRISSY